MRLSQFWNRNMLSNTVRRRVIFDRKIRFSQQQNVIPLAKNKNVSFLGLKLSFINFDKRSLMFVNVIAYALKN